MTYPALHSCPTWSVVERVPEPAQGARVVAVGGRRGVGEWVARAGLDHVSAGLHEYNRPEPVECPACRGVYCAGHGTM